MGLLRFALLNSPAATAAELPLLTAPTMKLTRARLPLLAGLAFLLVAALSGCGGDPVATVSGKVTYLDKPLPGGTVIFSTADFAKSATAEIKPDGTYSVSRVPLGDLKVAVQPGARSRVKGRKIKKK